MTATIQTKVDELTDDAIKKRIAVIDRLRQTRIKQIGKLQTQLVALDDERVGLVETQIERLRLQLPDKD